jgi:ADP-ribose pyrophosphatase YjhB (NUDIX family)
MTDFVMNFCPRCGKPMGEKHVYGRMRPVCPDCEHIFFRDPAVAVVVLAIRDGRALMVRRSMAPEIGKWAFPAGYLEYGEDPREAAAREVLEETGISVRITHLIDVRGPDLAAKAKASVVILFEAEVLGGEIHPEDDVDEAEFFSRDEVPLDQLAAFESIPAMLAAWDDRLT